MEGGQVKFVASGRGAVFFASDRGGYFRCQKVQTSGPHPINSEPSVTFPYIPTPMHLNATKMCLFSP